MDCFTGRGKIKEAHYQLALPVALRGTVLRSLHDDMGHMGMERTLDLVRTRFFWPKMSSSVEEKIKTCERCVRRKAFPEKAPGTIFRVTPDQRAVSHRRHTQGENYSLPPERKSGGEIQ